MTLRIGSPVIAVYCAIWTGIVIGVSFIATIAKFAAPTLTRPVALDVGRHTFATLAHIEWALFAVLTLLLLAAGINRVRLLLLILVGSLLAIEAIWLYPQLSARTDLVLGGKALPASSLHAVSVAAESSKVILLALFSIFEMRKGTL